ncbi:hypothetical protein ACNPQK_17400 [Acinetobacter guillouiae]|uniref:hypothetical protein n=1 Tax=Acinetobacter guillouiae TaxID=106649 RepID=UPI003AF6E313
MSLKNLLKIIHDGVIEGVFFDNKQDILTLFVRIDYEVRYELVFKGVLEYRVLDFGKQNIISRVINYQKDNFCHDEIFELLKWVSSNSDSSTYWSNDELRKIVEKIKSNDLALLYMEPSAGAEIVILFLDCIVKMRN